MVHSGASGRLAVHSETRVVLRRWVRKGVLGWHVPKEAFGLAFGTSVILRRFPKGCFDGASKGSSGRALRQLRKGFRDTRRSPKGFERGCSDVARPEGGSRKGLREGCCGLAVEGVFRRSLVPKGVFEGGFEEGLPRGCFGEFPRGCLRRRLRRGLPEGFPGGSSKEFPRGASGGVSTADGSGRWILNGRLRFIG